MFLFELDGKLTIGNSGELLERLSATLEQSEDILADFSRVEECDAAALQLILSWARTARSRGRGLRIAAVSPAIETACATLGLPGLEPADRVL